MLHISVGGILAASGGTFPQQEVLLLTEKPLEPEERTHQWRKALAE